MVKVRGKKLSLTTSEYVTKDLVGPKGKRNQNQKAKVAGGRVIKKKGLVGKKRGKNAGAEAIIEEDNNGIGSEEETEVGEVVGNEVLLPETRMSDAPPIKKVQIDI